jgi:hypothetical protein
VYSGAQTTASHQGDHAGAYQHVQESIMQSRDEYIKNIKSSIDKLNANMKVLEDRTEDAQKDARKTYEEQLVKMRAQSKLAIAKLDEMQTAGADTWENMVAEIEKIRDAFVHSFRYFKSQV